MKKLIKIGAGVIGAVTALFITLGLKGLVYAQTTPNTSLSEETSTGDSSETKTLSASSVSYRGILEQSTNPGYTHLVHAGGTTINLKLSSSFDSLVGKEVTVTLRFYDNSDDFIVESVRGTASAPATQSNSTGETSSEASENEQSITTNSQDSSIVTFEGILQNNTNSSFSDQILFTGEKVNLVLGSQFQSLVGQEVKVTVQFLNGTNQFHVISVTQAN